MSNKGRFVFGEKTKLLFRSLSLFSLFTFFIAGVAISRAETCECTTNTAFGGGDSCTGGTCDGCHCDYSNCTPSCACASSTEFGSTCSNGCGGTCNGMKTGGATNGDIKPLPVSEYKSIWQFQMTGMDGTKRPSVMGFKEINDPAKKSSFDNTIDLSLDSVSNCELDISPAWNISGCNYSQDELKTMKVYLMPGSVIDRVHFYKSQGSDSGGIVLMRFGEPPQGTYDSSFIRDPDNGYFASGVGNFSNTNGQDHVMLFGTSGIHELYSGSVPDNSSGGWLYIRIIPMAATIYGVNYSSLVYEDKYKSWYDKMTTNNNWDAYGDPIAESSEIDTLAYKSIYQFPVDYLRWNETTQEYEYNSSRILGWKDNHSPETSSLVRENTTLFGWSLPSCGSFAASNSMRCYHSNAEMHEVKLFFPPGAGATNVNLGTSQENDGSRIIVVARFGETPQGDYDSASIFGRTDISSLAANFSQVDGKDFLVSNGDGILDIFEDRLDENFTGGWLYLRIFESNKKILNIEYTIWIEDFEKYKTWYNNLTTTNQWQANGDPPETDPSVLPTGPDCASKTCVGNSCDSESTTAENPWISGTKTEGCATGEAKASPASITPKVEWTTETPAEEISYLTWTANNAKALEVQCAGPTLIGRGSIQLTSALWQQEAAAAGIYTKPTSTTPDGFPAWFHVGTSGTEVCTFYPTNKTDGLPGTPFSLTIQVLGSSTCGNNIQETGEECDYTPSAGLSSYVPCPTGKTCEDCACVVTTTNANRTNANRYVCQPDDPSCAKSTCKDVRCFDGCNYQQGTKDCKGRE